MNKEFNSTDNALKIITPNPNKVKPLQYSSGISRKKVSGKWSLNVNLVSAVPCSLEMQVTIKPNSRSVIANYCPSIGHNVFLEQKCYTSSKQLQNTVECLNLQNCIKERGGCTNTAVISKNHVKGMTASSQAYTKWVDCVDDPDLKDQLLSMAEPQIKDAFYKDLEFGTGGLRGIMGAGTNRINVYTVNKATQGLCAYLKSEKLNQYSVAIAYDSRNNSEFLARSAAEVIASNGGKSTIFSMLMPTPILSFAVRELGYDAGIVITASHNPAQYNGYKVYGNDGCQITLDKAQAIQECIKRVDIFNVLKEVTFGDGVRSGAIQFICDDLIENYYKQAVQCGINPEILKESDLKVIYTPLNGTGNKPVREVLTRAGLQNLVVVPEQENPDGDFTTCKKPNPEEPSVYQLAIELADKNQANILIATDPDGDRIGVAVKNGSEYTLLSGNETGCLLLNYILSMKKEQNRLPQNPVIIKTIVTSAMVYSIAKEYGAQVIDTLTGFKYIGEQLGLLEKKHEEGNYVFGFEESYGYLPETFVRDKDAVSTSLLICEMAAFYKKDHLTLVNILEVLYQKHGYWKHKLLSFSFDGADGMKKMKAIMSDFRKGRFASYAGLAVIKTDDYLNSVTVNKRTSEQGNLLLPKSDVIVLSLEKDCEIVIRPSGTEPKLKCYLTTNSKDNGVANQMLQAIESDLTLIIKMI